MAYCFGISLAVAAGATTLLSLVGLALSLAALIGIGGWAIWYRRRGLASVAPTRASRIGKDPQMNDRQPIVYIDLGVGGMTCADCVVHVTEALESVPGVEDASVDLASRSAVVTARAGLEGSALASAVRRTGQYNAFERRRRMTSGD